MSYEESVIATLKKIKGTYGLAIINENEPDVLIVLISALFI